MNDPYCWLMIIEGTGARIVLWSRIEYEYFKDQSGRIFVPLFTHPN
jgi:hypothetical protein